VALKDILVHLDQSERATQRLRLAVDLAARHGSRITALYTRELTAAQMSTLRAAELGLASWNDVARVNQSVSAGVSESRRQLEASLSELCCGQRIEFEWRSVDGPAATVVPQHARHADLCIVGKNGWRSPAAIDYEFSEELLFVTGRPVVLIPPEGAFETLGRHVVIAWNGSRAASRALHDALPLIERAERVSVFAADGTHLPTRPGALPPETILEHLRRHGATPELLRVEVAPEASVAAALLAEAHRLGADLLVSGAFGHPRLWEKLLGGVTQDLLARMSLPVMTSH